MLDTIKKLSTLCRIRTSKKEEGALAENLEKILTYVKQLQEVDTEGVEPCDHVLEAMTAPMRDDVIRDLLSRETYLAGAPDQVSGMIRVPPVFEEV